MRKKELLLQVRSQEEIIGELREENKLLYERLLEASDRPMLARDTGAGNATVYYMDDQRQIELQDQGHAPT